MNLDKTFFLMRDNKEEIYDYLFNGLHLKWLRNTENSYRPTSEQRLDEYYLFIDNLNEHYPFGQLSFCHKELITYVSGFKDYREINILNIIRDKKLNRVIC